MLRTVSFVILSLIPFFNAVAEFDPTRLVFPELGFCKATEICEKRALSGDCELCTPCPDGEVSDAASGSKNRDRCTKFPKCQPEDTLILMAGKGYEQPTCVPFCQKGQMKSKFPALNSCVPICKKPWVAVADLKNLNPKQTSTVICKESKLVCIGNNIYDPMILGCVGCPKDTLPNKERTECVPLGLIPPPAVSTPDALPGDNDPKYPKLEGEPEFGIPPVENRVYEHPA